MIGFVSDLKSQSLYFTPFGGVQSLLCSYDRKIGKVNTFKTNYLNLADDAGFMIVYQTQNRFSFSCGISFSKIGWSYSMTIPKDLIKNPYGISDKCLHSEALIMHRFPILFDAVLLEKKLLKDKSDKTIKTLQFKIGGGINVDNVPDIMDTTSKLKLNLSSIYGDTIKYTNRWNYIDHKLKTGISCAINCSFCFYNKIKNKSILELTFYYNQGLFNIINIDVNYQLNSIHAHSKLYSKGTNYGVILKIPVRLYNKRIEDFNK